MAADNFPCWRLLVLAAPEFDYAARNVPRLLPARVKADAWAPRLGAEMDADVKVAVVVCVVGVMVAALGSGGRRDGNDNWSL